MSNMAVTFSSWKLNVCIGVRYCIFLLLIDYELIEQLQLECLFTRMVILR